jgi:hypothetical protein
MFCSHLLAEMSGKRNAIVSPAAKITIELESVDSIDGPTVKIIDETSPDEEERSQKVFSHLFGNLSMNIFFSIPQPSPLLDAVENGDAAALSRHLQREKDVNLVYGPLRVTLLHIAAFHHPHLVPILLKHGAIANTLDTVGV